MILHPNLRFLISVLSLVVLLTSCSNDKNPEFQIILCIGQSNMAGRADIPPQDTNTLQGIYLFNDKNEWEPAKNPLNRYSTIRKEMSMQRLGPAWTFSQELKEKYPDRHIGLVVNVRGGTSIDLWKKGSHYYNEAVIKALKAQKTGRLIGIIWHQGEADRNKSEGYTQKFSDMVRNLRLDLGVPDLPIVVGEIGDWRGNSQLINNQIRAIPEVVPLSRCVNVDGLDHMGDSLHFSAQAQHVLGRLYAHEFLQMVNFE